MLVIVDYATRYPEAVPLPSLISNGVAHALMRLFAYVGLPSALLTGRGVTVYIHTKEAGVQDVGDHPDVRGCPAPPNSGLTEHLNQTLKGMLTKAIKAHPQLWDSCMDLIIFALQKSPQASTGVSPFELLYGQRPRGLLEVLDGGGAELGELLVQEAEPYVAQLWQHLQTILQLAHNNLARAQGV